MKALIFILLAMLIHMISTGSKDILQSLLIGIIVYMVGVTLVIIVMYYGICFILKKGTDQQIEDLVKAFRSSDK